MFMKRPKKDAKFRHTINFTLNAKRYSLALDKFRKCLALFYVAYHVFGTPEVKFRMEKLKMDVNELTTSLQDVLDHQRQEYYPQGKKCSDDCPTAWFLDFRLRRILATEIEAKKLAINLNLNPVGKILKKLDEKNMLKNVLDYTWLVA